MSGGGAPTARLRHALLHLAQASGRTARALARLTGLLIIAMMLGVVVDSLLRGTLGIAVWGVLELSTLILLALIYLGLPATQAERVNFRVSVFTDALPRAAQRAIAGALLVIQIAVLGILCVFAWRSAAFSWHRDEVSMGMVEIALWPHRVLVAGGLTLLCWQSVMSAIEFVLAGRHPYAQDLAQEVESAIGRQTL